MNTKQTILKLIESHLQEAFSDMGKLSDEQLKKGQRLEPQNDKNFHEVSGKVFRGFLTKLIKKDALRGKEAKGLADLSVYSVEEYNKMKCYIDINNSSGFVIKDGDELVSVFSTQGSSGDAIVKEAIKKGAKRLDCFAYLQDGQLSGGLYKLYSRHGFKVDKSLTTGTGDKPYDIVKGISYFTDGETVDKTNPVVVIFMKHSG